MDAMTLMRDAEIRALGLLDEQVPDVLGRIVRLAATVTGAAGARINVISSEAQHSLVCAYGEAEESGLGQSLCARILPEAGSSYVAADARQDPLLASSEFVTSGIVTSYAAEKLVTTNGVPIGTLCVFDPMPRDIPAEALATLAELSRIVMDLLEARRQQDEMRTSLAEITDGSRELRRSNEHLAAFAGQVSHDVQGPLAAVLMGLQLMEETREEEGLEVDPLLTSALSGAQRMRATIAGLMDFAVVGGRLAPVPLDMNEVVADVLADLTAKMGSAKVVVSDLPTVWGDHVQVRAVTQNLIANALKYAGSWPVIHVDGDVLQGRTRITVSDDGPGVPADQREAIFRLNVRGEGMELTGVDGLGIGLATCKRIIDSHGGSIGVDDSVSGGAAFWYDLPDHLA